ncbi:hypothetical protein PROFUN_09835 [Planoprotostelium fungivorum]|uniref:FAD-binding PCMH-type domain-containing protein n=1 Tax=Planoprotostelium fungivorum TaxID=1890364 RepID=A0A2P6NFL5_9EUKA|nr:hypothetical protein PROFUN_09835 [Planoprotostelium fungivorum]
MRSLLLLVLSAVVTAQLSGIPVLPSNNTFTCRPYQPCWPTLSQWAAFNQSIGGNLFATTPIGSPCFLTSPDYSNASCTFVRSQYMNPYYRQSHYGAMEYTNWETCGLDNCLPSMLGPLQNPTCGLGRLSSAYVQAQTTAHITATLAFIKQHNIRLVLRNTGHDYQGRSSSANSLALVTSSFKSMSLIRNFSTNSCPTTYQNIAVIGAGVTATEATKYFNQFGFAVTVGACPSVGIAGGFGHTAGHGIYSRAYGLMVDQAVEFDFITVDGRALTVNECNNPDLFWAMRGGGGGTYAILVNYKFKLHPLNKIAMYSFRATFPAPITFLATDSPTVRAMYTALATNETVWAPNNITGYNFVTINSVETHQILPVGSDPLGLLKELTADYARFMRNVPNISIIEDSYYLFNDQVEFEAGSAGVVDRHATVGLGVVTVSRLVPTRLFSTPQTIDQLVDAIVGGLDAIAPLRDALPVVLIQLTPTTPTVGSDPQRATAANPGWREAYWHAIIVGGWVQGETDAVIQATQALARTVAQPLIDLISTSNDTGYAYPNEADYAESNWKSVFWGSNYDRLSQIKAKYDPLNVLNCWKCVGFIGESDPMYSCYGANPQPSVYFNQNLKQ